MENESSPLHWIIKLIFLIVRRVLAGEFLAALVNLLIFVMIKNQEGPFVCLGLCHYENQQVHVRLATSKDYSPQSDSHWVEWMFNLAKDLKSFNCSSLLWLIKF